MIPYLLYFDYTGWSLHLLRNHHRLTIHNRRYAHAWLTCCVPVSNNESRLPLSWLRIIRTTWLHTTLLRSRKKILPEILHFYNNFDVGRLWSLPRREPQSIHNDDSAGMTPEGGLACYKDSPREQFLSSKGRLKGTRQTKLAINTFDPVGGIDILDKSDLIASGRTLARYDGRPGQEKCPNLNHATLASDKEKFYRKK